jgi:hypothetical protein
MTSGHDLVHFNLAIAKHGLGHPGMERFASQLEAVNRLAQTSPGFVWTAADGEAGDTAATFGSELALANISTWRSLADLQRFVYDGLHGMALRRRREWFEVPVGPPYVLWWVPTGYRPHWAEAKQRLRELEAYGPTKRAFTFKQAFHANGAAVSVRTTAVDRFIVDEA